MYINRDIAIYYKQTLFGPLWHIIQPLLTALMYMFIFGNVAHISTDGVPQALFYLSGIALWNYFSQSFSSCSTIFNVNQGIFNKVYFPRLVVPLASCTSNLIRFSIQFGIFLLVLLCYVIFAPFTLNLGMGLLCLPLLVIMTGLQGMAFGLLFTSWSIRYRDLQYVIPFILQLGMFATPVIYPLSFMPDKYRWIINLNPITPVVEAYRYCCLGVGTFDLYALLYSTVVLIVTLVYSVVVFNRKARNFVDII